MKVMSKLLTLILLLVFSSNSIGKSSKDDDIKLIPVGKYPRNKILIPIDNGNPPIKNVYIDLKISVTKWDKDTGNKLFNLKYDFIKKIRSEFNKTKPKLNLLKGPSYPSLGSIHMEPKNKHGDIINNASSLGVIKVKIAYANRDGQYYASVSTTNYDVSLYDVGVTQSTFWLGKSESLNQVLFDEVYDKVFSNLVDSNCYITEKEIKKCFKRKDLRNNKPSNRSKPRESANPSDKTVISLALKYKIHKAKASDIRIIKSYKKDGRKVIILKIKNSVCDMPMIEIDGKWSATGISCKG